MYLFSLFTNIKNIFMIFMFVIRPIYVCIRLQRTTIGVKFLCLLIEYKCVSSKCFFVLADLGPVVMAFGNMPVMTTSM